MCLLRGHTARGQCFSTPNDGPCYFIAAPPRHPLPPCVCGATRPPANCDICSRPPASRSLRGFSTPHARPKRPGLRISTSKRNFQKLPEPDMRSTPGCALETLGGERTTRMTPVTTGLPHPFMMALQLPYRSFAFPCRKETGSVRSATVFSSVAGKLKATSNTTRSSRREVEKNCQPAPHE